MLGGNLGSLRPLVGNTYLNFGLIADILRKSGRSVSLIPYQYPNLPSTCELLRISHKNRFWQNLSFRCMNTIVLILEDLHWADGATLDALNFMARRIQSAKLMVISTYRLCSDHLREESVVDERFSKLTRRRQFIAFDGFTTWPNARQSPCYAFIHIWYHQVVYDQIPLIRKQRSHRLIGERLEHIYGELCPRIASVLAMHFELGRDIVKFDVADQISGKFRQEAYRKTSRANIAYANFMQCLSSIYQGQYKQSINYAEKCLTLSSTDDVKKNILRYGLDSWSVSLIHKGLTNWCLGYPDKGFNDVQEALAFD